MDFNLPTTRYYGSKRKLIKWIWESIQEENLEFNSVLDLFGGSGIFSYVAKKNCKKVSYNDLFLFNYHIGKALIQNNTIRLDKKDIFKVLEKQPDLIYKTKIQDLYKDIYYTDEENKQLDIIIQNILNIPNETKRSLLYYILIQSCIMKRPYNLFHRKNLYIRLDDVKRSFGNKTTWETPFEDLFFRLADELNSLIFTNNKNNTCFNSSALDLNIKADLVYIDPPYINNNLGQLPYHSRYHFLEALVNYETFDSYINYSTKHLKVNINNNKDFESRTTFFNNLKILFEKYSNSHIVFSYRLNGIPSINDIESYLLKEKKDFIIKKYKYSYALHKNNDLQEEVLFIIKKSVKNKPKKTKLDISLISSNLA